MTSDPSTVAKLTREIDDADDALAEVFFACARYERPSTDWKAALLTYKTALSHPSVPNGRSAGEACEHPDCRGINRPAVATSPGIGHICKDHLLLCMAAHSPYEMLATPPAADGMEKDAQRYRWLRDSRHGRWKLEYFVFNQPPAIGGYWEPNTHGSDLDSAIDAAMLAAQPDESKGG